MTVKLEISNTVCGTVIGVTAGCLPLPTTGCCTCDEVYLLAHEHIKTSHVNIVKMKESGITPISIQWSVLRPVTRIALKITGYWVSRRPNYGLSKINYKFEVVVPNVTIALQDFCTL